MWSAQTDDEEVQAAERFARTKSQELARASKQFKALGGNYRI